MARAGNLLSMELVTQVTGLSISWWTAAVVVTLVIRTVVKPGGIFPHPFLFVAILNACIALCALFASALYWAFATDEPVKVSRRDVALLFSFGLAQGVEHGLSTQAASLLTVSMHRMIMTSCIVIQLITAVCWGLETLGPLKWFAASLLIAGGVLENLECSDPSGGYGTVCGLLGEAKSGVAASSSSRSLWLGAIFTASSCIVSSNRWAFTQQLFQRDAESCLWRLSKLQMLPYMFPAQALVCLILATFFEPHAFLELRDAAWDLVAPTLVISVAIMALIICELKIIQMTASSTLVILAVLHNIPIMLCGHFINGDIIYRNQYFGFIICIIGAIMYALARQDEENSFRPSLIPLAQSAEAKQRYM